MKKQKRKSEPRQKAGANKSRLALCLMGNFIWMMLLYQGAIRLSIRLENAVIYEICTILYVMALIVLLLVYRLLSQSAQAARLAADRDNAPEDAAAQAAYATGRARALLLWVFPIAAVIFVDFCDAFILDFFRQLLSTLR